jgi:hypothetical protein
MVDSIVTPGAAPAAGTGAGTPPPTSGAGANSSEKPGETPKAAEIRKFKALIDGKEVEFDEKDAVRAFQKEKASDKRFMDAAAIKKQAEGFLNQLKRATDDPRVLQKIIQSVNPKGNFKEIAEKYLYELIQDEQLTDEQRELKTVKEQLAQHDEEKRIQAEQQQADEAKALETKYSQSYQKDIIDVLEVSGLPKTAYTVARMARYMHMGLTRGVELTAKDIVEFVRKDYQAEYAAFNSLPTERLMELIGPEIANKLRQYDLDKVKGGGQAGPGAKPGTPPANPFKKPVSTAPKALTTKEFRELAEQRAST